MRTLGLLLLFGLQAAWAGPALVVLTSEDRPQFTTPAAALASTWGRHVPIHNLQGDARLARVVLARVAKDPPDVVVAFGAKAAWAAEAHLPQIPLVYAMVHNPEKYGIGGGLTTGVSMDIDPQLILAQFQVFTPKVQRIGIILGEDNKDPAVANAILAARTAGYEVVARRVASAKDVRRSYTRISQHIDAVWLLPDPVVITPANFHFIQAEATRAHLPVLAWSAALVQAGALLAVAPDLEAVGRQAGTMARQVLKGIHPQNIPAVAPSATRVVLNRDVQESIGLEIDPLLLDFVDEIVTEGLNR
jgi:ABC-type uncharacterized transport system substrate-binding protein